MKYKSSLNLSCVTFNVLELGPFIDRKIVKLAVVAILLYFASTKYWDILNNSYYHQSQIKITLYLFHPVILIENIT